MSKRNNSEKKQMKFRVNWEKERNLIHKPQIEEPQKGKLQTGILQGSITVEACLVVPFCFFALLSLLCPFQVLVKKQCVQAEMLQAVQMYSRQGEKIVSLKALAKEGVLLKWKEETGHSLCYAEYQIPIPFSGLGIGDLNCYQQMVVNDYKGISMVPDESAEGYVYLSTNSQVCHLNPQCTHLKVKLRKVNLAEAANLRNQSGEIYYPCEVCASDGKVEPVYITSYGTRYHNDKSCSKIQRNVRRILRSKVGNMPICSKCQIENNQKENGQ